MTPEIAFTLIILVLMILGMVFEWFAPDVIMFSALGIFLLTGILDPVDALSGFSNKGMMTVAVLFPIAFAVQKSGFLSAMADRFIGKAKDGRKSLLKIMLPVFGLSSFLNNTPVVAMFIPTVRDWALKSKISPSKFLIPLSYASIFGGICTLIGTSTNLVVSGMLYDYRNISLNIFDITLIGVPCAIGGFAFMMFIGHKLLPNKPDLLNSFAKAGIEYLYEMKVKGENLTGKTVETAGLRNLEDIYLVTLVRNGSQISPVKPSEKLYKDDILLFSGKADGIKKLQAIEGLEPIHDDDFCRELLEKGKARFTEVVVSNSSPMLDKTIKEGNFRSRYDAAVVAVHRHGEKLNEGIGNLKLKAGDTLLLITGDDFINIWSGSRDFYLISKGDKIPIVDKRKSWISLISVLAMILSATFGITSIFTAAFVVLVVLLLTKTLSVFEARRSLELNVIIVIAAALGVSKALEQTGTAGYLASFIVNSVGSFGNIGYLAAIYFSTTLLTEIITNNAAAALVFPIAMSLSAQLGLSPMPFAMAIAVAASASFSTPLGYQTNLMVYGPGGYKFSDFLKIGIPLNLTYMIISVILIPFIWSF
ncbi:SLC13 family permease [Flexistipes sp.]|uniref:SLC13 family permease n=1 Tax=Flexistipes sp. TaxID=3088135 RepID=UPI002E20F083|nr:SLC13 family permease [Flexistipes sp.]